jgi:hypothetical protein
MILTRQMHEFLRESRCSENERIIRGIRSSTERDSKHITVLAIDQRLGFIRQASGGHTLEHIEQHMEVVSLEHFPFRHQDRAHEGTGELRSRGRGSNLESPSA